MKMKILTAFVVLLTSFTLSIKAQRVFTHPGGILSKADLERIKQHVNAGDEPWKSCWITFQQDECAKSAYTAKATAEIGGSNGTRQRASRDAYAAMLNAIEWHVTGQVAYADCAARILTAWGDKLQTANDELYQYPCRAMIVAAEMLRTEDGFYEGWDITAREDFLDKVRTVMVPACRKFCTYQNSHPSWYTPSALAVLAAGVLLDDADLYQEGYKLMMATNHWGTIYGGSIEPDGQMREMGRDNIHAGLTLGDITQACLIAYNQGDDMFAEGDNRLLKGMEYWCKYNSGHIDVPFKPLDCSGLDGAQGYSFYYVSTHNNGFRLRPDACCFEAVYNHYKEVKGMDAETEFPYLTIAARLARPDTRTEMLGYGTLLFTRRAESSPLMTEVPQRPVGFTAEEGFRCVNLHWRHPEQEDVRGFRIYRSTNGTDFSLLTTWDYYTNNEYKDEAVELGKTYYYRVQFINYAGMSEQSEVVGATPQEGTDELPLGWSFSALGTKLGAGLYSEVQDSTFVVSGAGSDIGGTNDTEGFVYRKMTGDATLTVRLVSTVEAFYKVGIQMRSALSGNAQRIGLTLGEKGYRMLRGCTRSTVGGNTSWVNGTNYGRAPLWMRISRIGNDFTTYLSRDGQNWHQIHQATVSMPKTYYVGMASCSGNSTIAYQAIFDHVKLEGSPAKPVAVPAAPTGFSALWTDTDEATLTWNSTADADSFFVYRDNIHIATVRSTRYVDADAMAGTYTYAVSGWNSLGEGKVCAAKQVTIDKAMKLTGTIIGTTGSYGNNSQHTRSAALDGNLNTFYDAAEASGAWVGYDLGTRYTAQVVYVKYTPRSGYPTRMTGGKFQVTNKPDFSDAVTIATVQETPAEGVLTKLNAVNGTARRYRYLRYIGPDNGNCNIAEVQFFGRKEDETLVGIENVRNGNGDCKSLHNQCFDLSGRRVQKPANGIFIINGRKVLIK